MRIKLALAAFAAFLLAAVGLWPGARQGAPAQEKSGRQRLEYKVIVSSVDHFRVKQSVQADGKVKVISQGPRQSADAMTKQFNTLAAEGWEYVGPVTSVEMPGQGGRMTEVLSLFKRVKQ